jgi:hypothetical protein
MNRTFYELTDCTDGTGGAGAWMPSEYYVDLILEGIQTYGQLSGKAAVVGTDLAAGNGNVVNIRYVSAREHACANTSCGECLSSTSTTFGDYPVTVYQQGDYDKIADFADFQAKGDVMGAVANEMAKRLAHCRDLGLWQDLTGATCGNTETLANAYKLAPVMDTSCCTFSFDIYNKIIDARQTLMGTGYNPDYVLIHPYAAAYLYYKEGAAGYPRDNYPLLKYGADGYISTIAGMKVIEVKVAVTDDSSPSDSGDEIAFVIDSSRALAEAWGQRPKFNEWYDGACNATELTVWSYWGHGTLDTGAIVEIVNP